MGHRARPRLAFGVSVAWCLSSVACAGGQTGEGPPEDNVRACDDFKHEIELDDDEALGFAPRRLLELASASLMEPLHWRESDPGFSFGPEHGVSTITIGVNETDLRARYVDAVPWPDADPSGCPDFLELDVVLQLRSEGGALDET